MDTNREEKSWDWVEEQLVLPGAMGVGPPGKTGKGGFPGMARARPPGATGVGPPGGHNDGSPRGHMPDPSPGAERGAFRLGALRLRSPVGGHRQPRALIHFCFCIFVKAEYG